MLTTFFLLILAAILAFLVFRFIFYIDKDKKPEEKPVQYTCGHCDDRDCVCQRDGDDPPA